MSNGKTFVKISNNDIYQSIQELHVKMEKFDIKVNNLEGKSNYNKMLIYGVFSILALLISVLVAHIMGVN